MLEPTFPEDYQRMLIRDQGIVRLKGQSILLLGTIGGFSIYGSDSKEKSGVAPDGKKEIYRNEYFEK